MTTVYKQLIDDVQRMKEKIVELDGRIVELENQTCISTTKPIKKRGKIRVSGIPYEIDVEDIVGGGN